MKDLAERVDLVSITRSKYWNEIRISFGTAIPQNLMQEIFSIVNEKTINKGFISFLYATTGAWKVISPELAQLSMHYFPLLFQSGDGIELAIRLFVETPLRTLVSSNIEYPKTFPISFVYYKIEEEQVNRLLEKV